MVPNLEEEIIDDANENEFEIITESTTSPRLYNGELLGEVEGLDALIQDINIKLSVERYEYASIFPNTEFVEFRDLIGQDIDFVEGELQLRIEDCLLQDDRIDSLDNFEIEQLKEKGCLSVSFLVHSIYGDAEIEKELKAEEVI